MPYAQKSKYRITLEIEAMDDFNPHQIDWEKLFELQGDEKCEAYVEDLSTKYDSLWWLCEESVEKLCQSDKWHMIFPLGWKCLILDSWERKMWFSPTKISLFFSVMFATTLNTIDDILEFDYQQLWTNILTIGAICAVILGAMYHQLRKVKFSTPHEFADKFYFGVNFTPSGDNDERFGVSIKNAYFGIYGNTAHWGILNQQGCLWTTWEIGTRPLEVPRNLWDP